MDHQKETPLSMLIIGISFICLIIISVGLFKHYHKKEVVLERFNQKLQVIFDDEVKDAIKACRPTISSVPIRHFTQYEVDCDDLSVISDPDVDYAEYLSTRK